MSRPWSKESLPTVAAWLEASERPITLIVEATKRPRRYDPLIAIGDAQILITAVQPIVRAHREAARVLTIRAMFKLSAGKVEEAWQDLLACHRLSRLTGHGGTLLDTLVAISIDSAACAADQALLAHGNSTAAQARRMHADLQELPPLPKMVDAIDLCERYMFLDCVQSAAERGLGWLINSFAGGGSDESNTVGRILSGVGALAISWDVILRMGNTWYDRLVAAQLKPTWTERSAAMGEIEAELTELSNNVKDVKSLALSMFSGPGRAVPERIGQVLVDLFLGVFDAAVQAEARGAESFEVVKLGFLLAAYRAENGKYPAQLLELSPKYLAEVPPDPFSGKPLIYKRRQNGYFLYSVGVNGKDDRGLSYDDRGTTGDVDQDYDDLVVQVPLKPREQQRQ